MRRSRLLRAVGGGLVLGLVALNVVAYRQAHGFTHFAPVGPRTRIGQLSAVEVLIDGPRVPRPENRRTPADIGLAYERHVFRGGRGVALEAWLVHRTDAHGTVVLFHGHAASKDSQLREARAFHGMGFNALLVDFYGSGGSDGSGTSIG